MDERTNCCAKRVDLSGLLWRAGILCFLASILLYGGCGPSSEVATVPETAPEPVEQLPADPSPPKPKPEEVRPTQATPDNFAATRIEIVPLTELSESTDGQGGMQLNVFLSVLDAFGSQMKTPAVLRFELYEYVQRSAEPKGQRVAIWPDIDLTDPVENHRYWRDFLRAYEFVLRTDASKSRTYVLEATCLRPEGRLSTEWLLRPSN